MIHGLLSNSSSGRPGGSARHHSGETQSRHSRSEPVGLHGYLWISMATCGSPWLLVGLHGYLALLQLGLQVSQVHVSIAEPSGPTQTDPIYDGGVVQLVRHNRIVRAQQNLPSERGG